MTEAARKGLDPWELLVGFLFEYSSDTVMKVISRTGVQVDWNLTTAENASGATRLRAFAPRIRPAYDSISNDLQLAAVGILATELAQLPGIKFDVVNARLEQIGWKIQENRIVPVKPQILEAFFPAGTPHDAYREIRGILGTAGTSVTIIDSWIDSTIFSFSKKTRTSCIDSNRISSSSSSQTDSTAWATTYPSRAPLPGRTGVSTLLRFQRKRI